MKTTIKQTVLATVATFAIIGCDGSNGTSNAVKPYDAPPISELDKNAYLSAVNGARSVGRSCGGLYYPPAKPLAWNTALYTASYEHSEDMSVTKYFEHQGSGTASDWTSQIQELGRGSESNDRATNNGYKVGALDENIAEGYTALNEVMNAWLKSSSHCEAIMSPVVNDFGMARVGVYWTQLFANEI